MYVVYVLAYIALSKAISSTCYMVLHLLEFLRSRRVCVRERVCGYNYVRQLVCVIKYNTKPKRWNDSKRKLD